MTDARHAEIGCVNDAVIGRDLLMRVVQHLCACVEQQPVVGERHPNVALA